MKAHTQERKVLSGLRRVFGRALGALKKKQADRQAALQALSVARRELTAYRAEHPEIIAARVIQETLFGRRK